MQETKTEPSPCKMPGCDEPQAVHPTARNSHGLCRRHEYGRSRAYKRRIVTDPVTGRLVTAGTLAVYDWARKRVRAEMAADAESRGKIEARESGADGHPAPDA